MGEALGADVARYRDLLAKGTAFTETDLYNGEYFIQKIQWEGLRAGSPTDAKSMVGEYSPEAIALLKQEGPKYQYGDGCLADGVLGSWMALVCGVGQVLDRAKVESHLLAVHRHNLRRDLSTHSQPAAAVVRGRQGRRAADLHLAARRQADAAVRLLGRGVDRHRVSGRVAPDAARPRRRRASTSCAPRGPATTAASATRSTSTSAATGTRGRWRPTRCCRG